MMAHTEGGLTTTEVARRLAITPEDVYRLIFERQLPAGPDSEGVVRVSEEAVDAYLARSTSRPA